MNFSGNRKTYCSCGMIPDLSVTGVMGVMGVIGVMGQKGEAPVPISELYLACWGAATVESWEMYSEQMPLSWEISRPEA